MHIFLYFFFFSSRRRHTRLQGDWSSDVCSSDLVQLTLSQRVVHQIAGDLRGARADELMKLVNEENHLSLRVRGFVENRLQKIGRASCRERGVDLGGRRIIKKKKKRKNMRKEYRR